MWTAFRFFTIVVLSASTLLPSAAAAATTQPPPPTLTGENLQIPRSYFYLVCDMTAQPHSWTFSVSGTGSGSYVGPFSAAGSGESAYYVNFHETTFTIQSPQMTVTGSTAPSPNGGGCYQDADNFQLVGQPTAYTATIHTPYGNFTDTGTATVYEFVKYQGTMAYFGESFTSSQTQTTLIVPTSKDQCTGNGWQNYPQFKNQGECTRSIGK